MTTLPDVPGAVTQAKRLDILPSGLAEVARLMTGESIDPDQLSLEVRVGDRDIERAAREIADLEDDLNRVTEALASRR